MSIRDADLAFNDPSIIPDPYPLYRAMRSEAPAHLVPLLGGTWLFLRHPDVRALLRDPRLSANRAGLPLLALPAARRGDFADMAAVLERFIGMQDQPAHRPLRQGLNRVFADVDRAYLRSRIEPVAARLVSAIPAGRPVDVIAALCRPLPALVACDVLGLPADDHEQVAEWSDDLAHLFGSSTLTIDEVERGRRSTLALDAHMRAAARRSDLPADGLLHRLAHTEFGGALLGEEQVSAQAVLLLFAGLEPTRFAIGNALHALASHPDQLALLRADEGLMDGAVEEFLRYDSPVQWVARIALESFEFHGCAIERGQPVLPYVAAANRDPDVFDRPDELDLRRPSTPGHVSFGHGPHHCIGAQMVREQVAVVLATLLRRFSTMERDSDSAVEWNTNLGFHGHRVLRMVFDGAGRAER